MQNLIDQQRLLFQLDDLPKENFAPNQAVTFKLTKKYDGAK